MTEDFRVGDLVLIMCYQETNPWHDTLGIIIGPRMYAYYPVLLQTTLTKKNIVLGELEKLA